ncbi:MAG: hypothetical protein QOJ40_394 [Verrucomicrobiota bacterium]
MNNEQPNSLLWWVVPNVLAGMAKPFVHHERRTRQGGALDAYDDDLPVLYSAGIRAVVSLLNLPTDAPVYYQAGFQFLCLPVLDGCPPTMEQADTFAHFVVQQRGARRPTAVHCEAGVGRTGTMIASYLISMGDSAEAAIQRVRSVKHVAVETPRQVEFLEEYAKRCQKARL